MRATFHHWALRHTRWLGVVGPSILVAGAFVASFGFQRDGEFGYSFLNHKISDLGDPRHSGWAIIFNAGMMLGSTMTALFTYGVGRRMNTRRSPRITAVGVAGAVGMGLVGLFPSAPPTQMLHGIAAGIAFVCTLVLGASFTVDILRSEQEVLPRWLVAPGALAACCSGSFLLLLIATRIQLIPKAALHFGHAGHRPMVDLVSVLEWSVLFSILLWSFLTAASYRDVPVRVSSDNA